MFSIYDDNNSDDDNKNNNTKYLTLNNYYKKEKLKTTTATTTKNQENDRFNLDIYENDSFNEEYKEEDEEIGSNNNNNGNNYDDGDDDEDNDKNENNDEVYYDALSDNNTSFDSFNIRSKNNHSFNNENKSSNNDSIDSASYDNISTLSQDELKLIEHRRTQVEKFKLQEDYIRRKIDEITQNELNHVKNKTALYNEKCRNELNELRILNKNKKKTKINNNNIDIVDCSKETNNNNNNNNNIEINDSNSRNNKNDNSDDNKNSSQNNDDNNDKDDKDEYDDDDDDDDDDDGDEDYERRKFDSFCSSSQLLNKLYLKEDDKNDLLSIKNNNKIYGKYLTYNTSTSKSNVSSNNYLTNDINNCAHNINNNNNNNNNNYYYDHHHYYNASKSKTWPEKEFKLNNNNNIYDDDTNKYKLNLLTNEHMASNYSNNKDHSRNNSFESALTNINLNDDLTHNKPFIRTSDSIDHYVKNNTDSINDCDKLTLELINPVDKQIMQLKSINPTNDEVEAFDSEENSSKNTDTLSIDTSSELKTKTLINNSKDSIRKVFYSLGKAVKQVRDKAEEVLAKENEEDEEESDSEDEIINEAAKIIKHKSARSNKGPYDFEQLKLIQILSCGSQANSNAIIWALKFSPCGKFLASAGKDQLIRIWVLRSYYAFYKDLVKKYNRNESIDENNLSNTSVNTAIGLREEQAPFYSKPFIIYKGHAADILDLSWSKNLFLLSASSDKTVRLWHIYKSDCLCCFYHTSIISAISFHPIDDRYFVSACLDGKIRLWNISEKKVARWNELSTRGTSSNFITAVCFCQSAKTIAVGTYDGKCILYQTELLKYYSLINVRSTRGKNSKGSKITGIEVLNTDENKILITSNDSRIRLYDLRDLSLICKYKGFNNTTVHIKASLSPDDKYIISGSENKWTYIWKTNHHTSILASATGIRRDRNMYFERLLAHNSIVTCALFAPNPALIINQINQNKNTQNQAQQTNIKSRSQQDSLSGVHCICSAAGCENIIKIFVNKLNI